MKHRRRPSMVQTKVSTHIAGRHNELQEIRNVLDRVMATRNTAVVLVEGEGGATPRLCVCLTRLL